MSKLINIRAGLGNALDNVPTVSLGIPSSPPKTETDYVRFYDTDFVPLPFYGTNADDMIAYIVSRISGV